MTITVEEAQEIVWGGPGAGHVAIQDVEDHRWYTMQLVVFRRDHLGLMGFYYMEPASEMQEDQDRFLDDPVHIFPVDAKSVVTTIYERRP